MSSSEPAIVIESAQGPAFVQDGGRRGAMHHAVPPGGALVPEQLAAAQRALGHEWNEAGIEIFGALSIRAVRDVRVSLDGDVHALRANESLTIRPSTQSRARYLALEGGIDVPLTLGGRGTLVSAGIGGFEGRALRRGDALRTRGVVPSSRRQRADVAASLCDTSPFRVIAGPDLERFAPIARDTLTRNAFTMSVESDRVGARLDGTAILRVDKDDGGSRPMVRGAIEVPADGRAIVLGPDHPTTGGYPVVAVLIRADHGRFAARRPGAEVRFTEVSLERARAAWIAHAARWFSDGP
jgi:biotin-dependent carboxylase-like uncharacterized protein